MYTPDTEQNYAQQEPATDAAAREKYTRRFNRGMQWLGAGIALLLLNFAVNFLLFHSGDDFSLIMYGMTSLGVVGILKGMGDILGF